MYNLHKSPEENMRWEKLIPENLDFNAYSDAYNTKDAQSKKLFFNNTDLDTNSEGDYTEFTDKKLDLRDSK